MIPYLEIRDKYTLKALALVEPQECWFELSYQEVGQCEIYCSATKANLSALQKGRFVTIPNKRFIWIITAVQYTLTEGGARMISARGYEAKWLLSKRCILTPKELNGTITSAVYGLVNSALGTAATAERSIKDQNGISKFFVSTNKLLIDISGTQAPRGNLLEFVSALLTQYNCGHIVELANNQLIYRIFTGAVKVASVVFAQSLDNLLTSSYLSDDAEKATSALVVSTVEDVEYTKAHDSGATGIDRAEVVLESNISTKYEDANGAEKETTPDSDLYQGWMLEEGKKALAERITLEEIAAELDLLNSRYAFDVDYFLGDMVRARDEFFGFTVDAVIRKYTIKQDANGYGEEAEYGR